MTHDSPEEQQPRALHHRLYPYMEELVQYASETADPIADPEARPWIVRDRSTALRNERTGRGRAMFRTWIPTDWAYVNEDDDE